MNVQILELLEGARQARGTTVVIDVFRAFSLEAWLYARGAKQLYAVGAESEARAMKERLPDAVLVGERGGKILPGFDFGNSPSQTEGFDWNGKTVIHTTSAGTQGLVAAAGGADE
ncbi:MAG: 2-phosphosulfolactate phosphatase, partial [Pyramidobacter sp.]|nr:2-phosphosulfolactate phosphatase [Pyramidobacter sp.]